MQRNIAEVANETREVALFDFFFGGGGGGGGQLPVTCERCNICTVTGEGTSFWNIVRHSFTINFVLAVFLREVPIRTYVVICDVRRQKVHWVIMNAAIRLDCNPHCSSTNLGAWYRLVTLPPNQTRW